MNKEGQHNAFDKFFRDRYGKHELNPPDELWDQLSSKVSDGDGAGFDETFRDLYHGHKAPPPEALWGRIKLHISTSKTASFIKQLSLIKWLGILTAVAVIGITQKESILQDRHEENVGAPANVDGDLIERKEPLTTSPANYPQWEKEESSVLKRESPAQPSDESISLGDESIGFGEHLIERSPVGQDELTQDKEMAPSEKEKDRVTMESFALGDSIRQAEKPSPISEKNDTTDQPALSIATPDSVNNQDEEVLPSSGNEDLENGDIAATVSEKETKRSVWSLAAYLSPTYSSLALNDPNQRGENEFYNSHQNGSWHLTGGSRALYHLDEKWSLSFGIGYDQVSQKLEFSDISPSELPHISMDSVNKIITVYSFLNTVRSDRLESFEFSYPAGDPNNRGGYRPVNYLEELDLKFLTIPITARYLHGNGKFKGIVDAGFSATLLISDASLIQIASTGQPQEIVSFRNYHSIKTFGFQFTSGLGCLYEMNEGVSLLFLPSFNYSSNDWNKRKYSAFRPWDIQILLGIQYRL